MPWRRDRLQMLVMSIYGHAESDEHSKSQEERLLQAALDEANRWGARPSLWVTSIDVDLASDPVLATDVQTSKWLDIAALAVAMRGDTPGNTCYCTSEANPGRIYGMTRK